MDICILDLDTPPPELVPEHGTYGDMFMVWLAPALPEARFSRVVIDGDGDATPRAADYDGFLLSGSRHGVYDKLPWMARVKRLISDAGEAGVPVTGVCFGHQIMAEAYGGQVVKSPGGWVLGNMDYQLTEAGEQHFGNQTVQMLAMHQDQVVAAPSGSRILLGNAQCPIAGLDYSGRALSVQFHPEFTLAFAHGLLETFGDGRVPEPVLRTTLSQLAPAPSRDKVAEVFAAFYRNRANRTVGRQSKEK